MAQKIKAIDNENYIPFSILAALLPAIRVVMGTVYITKDEKVDKKLGEHLIALSVLFFILWGILLSVLMFRHASQTIPVTTTVY